MPPVNWPIGELLPHAPPMVLLDEVLACDAISLCARVTVRPETRFFRAGFGVPAHIGLEWMAQACGAFAGARAKAAGEAVKLGFLLGTRGFTATQPWFTEGESLRIDVRQTFEEDGMAAFDCRIEADRVERASARLTVYQPADPASVLAAS